MMQSSTTSGDRLDEPVVLHFENSPYQTLDAIVQHDGKSVYFYLNDGHLRNGESSNQSVENQPVFGTRACWVRNLDLGPLVLNETEMRQGISPMLPRTHCVHREAQPIPEPERLQVVWLEEGNGAALFETGPGETEKILAVIPPWSGLEGFWGYASDCAIESPLCWPMPDNPKLDQRINQAKQFWQQWRSGHDPFAQLQPEILAAYEAQFLHSTDPSMQQRYFAIDGGSFPPRGLVQYTSTREMVLATVGMSVCPQPAVELFTGDPVNHRRIELAIRVAGDFSNESKSSYVEQLGRQLSTLAGYPWRNFTWLGAGHTCGLLDAAPGCESALLVGDDQLGEPLSARIELPIFRGDPVKLLWLIPINSGIQQQLEMNTLSTEEIIAAHCKPSE